MLKFKVLQASYTYTYDAWGKVYISYSNGGASKSKS